MKRSERIFLATIVVLAAGVTLGGHATLATAQTGAATIERGDDLRAVHAGPADIAEGKALFNAGPVRTPTVMALCGLLLASPEGLSERHAQLQRFTFGLNSWPTALRVKRWEKYLTASAL